MAAHSEEVVAAHLEEVAAVHLEEVAAVHLEEVAAVHLEEVAAVHLEEVAAVHLEEVVAARLEEVAAADSVEVAMTDAANSYYFRRKPSERSRIPTEQTTISALLHSTILGLILGFVASLYDSIDDIVFLRKFRSQSVACPFTRYSLDDFLIHPKDLSPWTSRFWRDFGGRVKAHLSP